VLDDFIECQIGGKEESDELVFETQYGFDIWRSGSGIEFWRGNRWRRVVWIDFDAFKIGI